MNPKFALAYNNRGYICSVMGDYDQALVDCNLALQLNPSLVNGYGSRGHTYFLMGRFEEALTDFDQSANLKPSHAFAIAGQAIAHHALGHLDEAKSRWQTLLRLHHTYQNPDQLMDQYHCADAFLEAARKVAAL